MKNSTITITVIILILLCGGLYFSFEKSDQKPTTSSVATSTATSTLSTGTAISKTECHSNDKYFVISQDHEESVGSEILAKTKSSASEPISCQLIIELNDFVLNDPDSAQYYLGLSDHFLFIDVGTAPEPRGLEIYDIATKKQVYKDTYSQPIQITATSTTYWTPTITPPTTAICPKLEENTKNGLGTLIESHVRLDLKTMIKTPTGETRCVATQ